MEKPLFINNIPSNSYSQFLQTNTQLHQFTETSDSFVDIEFFRRSISIHYQNLYATKKRQNILYRFLFFGFGILFLILGILIFFKTTNAACGLFFGNCSVIKNCVDGVCLLFSSVAFTVGYIIHPEKDAIHHLVSRVERELKNPVKQLQVEFNAIFKHFSQEWAPAQQPMYIKKSS